MYMNARQRRKRERWKERVSKNESTSVRTNTDSASSINPSIKNEGWKRLVKNYFKPDDMDQNRHLLDWIERYRKDAFLQSVYKLEDEPKSFF